MPLASKNLERHPKATPCGVAIKHNVNQIIIIHGGFANKLAKFMRSHQTNLKKPYRQKLNLQPNQNRKKERKGREARRFASTAFFLLLFTLPGVSVLNPTSAQEKQPQSTKPVIELTGEYTEWSEGPDGASARTGVRAPDGSSLTIYDYVFFKSGKRIKELLENCTKDALTVLDDSKLTDAKGKGKGRRILAIFRDREGRESAVLCRSPNNKMLTTIHGKTVEHVVGFERTAFPK